MMMIELEINDKAFEATLTSIEEVEGFYRGAEVLLSNMYHRAVESWRMRVYFDRELTRSYGSIHSYNAGADFYHCIDMEKECA